MDAVGIQSFWEKISVNKTPGTMPISDKFWRSFVSGDSILEVGCAWGRIIFECLKRDLNVVGIDINQEEVEALKSKLQEQNISEKSAKVFEASILSSNLKNDSFNGAIMLGVLSGLPKDKRLSCLKEIFRLLKNNGLAYIGEFELNSADPIFLERYKNDQKITGEYGTLSVKDENGSELYQSHNFSVPEITALITESGLTLETITKDTFISYHGNHKPGLMIIAKKVI